MICGNFGPEKEGQETYSGGADSTAFRVMVKKDAEMDWEGATLDVKTASLNASFEEDDEEWIVIRPRTSWWLRTMLGRVMPFCH